MPQFELDRGTAESADAFDRLDIFTQAYIEAMFWLATDWADQDESGNPNEHPEWDVGMLAHETVAAIVADCSAFQSANAEDLAEAGDDAQNGHDFWLTRNRHGAGFWDRGYDKAISDRLTADAHAWGEADLYRGDDGRLYLS